jgi:hypothetical protein
MVMKTINTKATPWLPASLCLWMGVLCSAASAQTGTSQGRWATEHEEMLIEQGYIFFPPLRTRSNSPQEAPPSAPTVPLNTPSAAVRAAPQFDPAPQTTAVAVPIASAPASPPASAPASALKAPLAAAPAMTKQDAQAPTVASTPKADAQNALAEPQTLVMADTKPPRPPIKEKSLLILTFK